MRSRHRLARPFATAALALGVLVTALAPGFAHAADGKVTVQWFGQSAFKITTVGGKTILVDPFITKNPKTPPEHKDLAALGRVDLVLVTQPPDGVLLVLVTHQVTISAVSETFADSGTGVLMALTEGGRLERIGTLAFGGARD